jgi:hypothetical protein
LDDNPAHIPPLVKLPFPDDFVCLDVLRWKTISSWYSESREFIILDILHRGFKLDRLKLIVKPDLSDASLHVINSSILTLHNFQNASFASSYRICDDTLVSFWCNSYDQKYGVTTGLTSAHFSNDVPVRDEMATANNCSLCPASGRFVHFTYDTDDDGRIVVVDLI